MGFLRIKHLGKAYKLYRRKWSRLAETVIPGSRRYHDLYWPIRGINFEITPGEAMGIIGRNGAGKSTLLKIITGTIQATEGTVEKSGRIAALLELGLGFHPDYTGRQNVALMGLLLGFDAEELGEKMTEIEEFAEIGWHMDEPIRTYSSGMQVRLAFSVATAVRPDILIVDEALSVGDLYFQHKCFARIRQFKEQGTTLLFVSHDPAAIKSICDRAILLDEGKIAFDGIPQDVLDYYNALVAKQEKTSRILQIADDRGKIQTRSGSGEATVVDVHICNDKREAARMFDVGEKISLEIIFKTHVPLSQIVVGFLIKDKLGNDIYGTNTFYYDHILDGINAGSLYRATFGLDLNLGQGSYSVTVALTNSYTHLEKNYEWLDRAAIFEVVNLSKRHFVGLAYLSTVVSVIKQSNS